MCYHRGMIHSNRSRPRKPHISKLGHHNGFAPSRYTPMYIHIYIYIILIHRRHGLMCICYSAITICSKLCRYTCGLRSQCYKRWVKFNILNTVFIHAKYVHLIRRCKTLRTLCVWYIIDLCSPTRYCIEIIKNTSMEKWSTRLLG